ncbi:6-pyruvoyl trahydropterin synthase family protein [Actinomadura sp. 3N508]|uniref:6-pyruvoyl trahydropterin synthase family protein n=1 Tax=Actinomadura sp. 3N508 TaxID=3375153 RepID=UPI0037B07A4E
MRYRISKRFTFEAAHRLDGLPEGHKCGRQHGHSYAVEVVLTAARLSGPGFITDFAVLDAVKAHLADVYDHQDLNEVIDVEPTSENLARVLFDWCTANVPLPEGAMVESVRVSETSATWAEYGRTAASV